MKRKTYGGPWAEARALVATWLLGRALAVHFEATMDMVEALAGLDDRP